MTACEHCWGQAYLNSRIRGTSQAHEYQKLIDANPVCPAPDPETLCAVCGNDTPTVRCCGQDLDYDRNM